jgi:hypothetical protein
MSYMPSLAQVNELVEEARTQAVKIGLTAEQYFAATLLSNVAVLSVAFGEDGAEEFLQAGSIAREHLLAALVVESKMFGDPAQEGLPFEGLRPIIEAGDHEVEDD